jgi:myo-inositol-1-phosphate synthase
MEPMSHRTIRIAIAGVGNCASALVQGLSFYRSNPDLTLGLMHHEIGGYRVGDIEVVAAFDIDARKVGRPLEEAVFAPPNNTKVFHRSGRSAGTGVSVRMAPVLDGLSEQMMREPEDRRFVPHEGPPVDVARVLRDCGTQVLVNYVPVGAQRATELYAEACLAAGVALVNCVPVFIISDPAWAARFTDAGLPCVGDDIKAQLGATITHRTLARLFTERGVRVDSTYQLNTGGNTDFLNMLEQGRLTSKRISKTEAVRSQLAHPLDEDHIHIGPSDYVPFLKDNKICFLRIEGHGFGGVPLNLELRLSVEDSPNSAGVVVDAIRYCRLAADAGMAGPIDPVCAWTMKRPPRQMTDSDARLATEEFTVEAEALIAQQRVRAEERA